MKTFLDFLSEAEVYIVVLIAVIVVFSVVCFVLPTVEGCCDMVSWGYAQQVPAPPDGYEVLDLSVTEWYVVGRHAGTYHRSSSVFYCLELENEDGDAETASVTLDESLEVPDGTLYYGLRYELRPNWTYWQKVRFMVDEGAPFLVVLGLVAVWMLVCIIDTAAGVIKDNR